MLVFALLIYLFCTTAWHSMIPLVAPAILLPEYPIKLSAVGFERALQRHSFKGLVHETPSLQVTPPRDITSEVPSGEIKEGEPPGRGPQGEMPAEEEPRGGEPSEHEPPGEGPSGEMPVEDETPGGPQGQEPPGRLSKETPRDQSSSKKKPPERISSVSPERRPKKKSLSRKVRSLKKNRQKKEGPENKLSWIRNQHRTERLGKELPPGKSSRKISPEKRLTKEMQRKRNSEFPKKFRGNQSRMPPKKMLPEGNSPSVKQTRALSPRKRSPTISSRERPSGKRQRKPPKAAPLGRRTGNGASLGGMPSGGGPLGGEPPRRVTPREKAGMGEDSRKRIIRGRGRRKVIEKIPATDYDSEKRMGNAGRRTLGGRKPSRRVESIRNFSQRGYMLSKRKQSYSKLPLGQTQRGRMPPRGGSNSRATKKFSNRGVPETPLGVVPSKIQGIVLEEVRG
ncbi:unnamed protein product [Cylicocyclus nassatus]|uniref:Uncharacterized protein n=1 Tax=Cylicocyclus nassatus TaxID=53992 RepID=A0AA36HA74_CYLNA|nr:unnamed protein product [Cylicocyclus nassatus]